MIRVVATLTEGLSMAERSLLDAAIAELGWEHTSCIALSDPALPLLLSVHEAEHSLIRLIGEHPVQRFLVFGPNCVKTALWCLRHGASDYLVLNAGTTIGELTAAMLHLQEARTPRPVSYSGAGRAVFRLARRVAATDIPVLLQGPSGSGKEVLANFIHQHSARLAKRLVAVNCAAMPETMLESLLFGHERGAFTGADRRREGKFLQASGGTLLLDEITEMPMELQAKLLRAIQEQEIEPLGASEPLQVDVRVIATTNREPAAAIADGYLREDLYYRLSVFPLRVPALKERPEDILPLAIDLVRRYGSAAQVAAGFADQAERRLLGYDWPGNVRELENVVRRALVLNDGGPIDLTDVGLTDVGLADVGLADGLTEDRRLAPPALSPTLRENGAGAESLKHQLNEEEDALVLDALRRHDYRRGPTARALGISERTLRNKLRRLRASGVLQSAEA